MWRMILAGLGLVAIAAALGATVFRDEVAAAADKATNVFVTNDASSPVPVREQGTVTVSVANAKLPVDAGFETQLVLDQVFTNDQRATIDVSAYKTIHVDFDLVSGDCFGSGARLFVLEASRFLNRGQIGADDACVSGFTGETIEMPGRSLTLIASIPHTGNTWRVVVFGRAN